MSLAIIFLSSVFPAVRGLRTAPGSPCADVCGKTSNTTSSEIACLDSEYDEKKGQDFEKCVTCLLESSYLDRTSGDTDVNWGLCMLIDLLVPPGVIFLTMMERKS